MKIQRLVLKDFLTYEELDYAFESKAMLIQGLNLTDDGQATNGTGKSGMMTGIEFAITASNSKGVNDAELISYGKDQANVQLYVSCDIRKETLWIDYDINKSGSNKLRISSQKYEAEEFVKVKFSNVNDGKKYIADWFDISREDLFNYFIINNTKFKSFFKASNTEKVALINRFSDARIVQGLEDIDTEELEEERSAQYDTVTSTKGKIELTEETLEREQNRDFEQELSNETAKFFDTINDLENKIDSLTIDIDQIELGDKIEIETAIQIEKDKSTPHQVEVDAVYDSIQDINEELEEAEEKVEECKTLLDSFEVIDFDTERLEFDEQIEAAEEEETEFKKTKLKKEKLKRQILEVQESIAVKLSGTIVCPKCTHNFILDGDIDELKTKQVGVQKLSKKADLEISQVEEQISKTQATVEKLEKSISKINERQLKWNTEKSELAKSVNTSTKALNEISKKLAEEQDKLSKLNLKEEKRKEVVKLLENQLLQKDKDIKNIQEKIKLRKEEIKVVEQQIKNLEQGDNSERISDLKIDLVKFKQELNRNQIQLAKTDSQLYNKKLWGQNFKQFKLHLANQSLDVIQYHCNRYLKELGSDIVVKIEGFKLKADNTVKDEISSTVIRNGEERNFSSFSGGERGRLIFAMILANRFMINESNQYGGLDNLFIDEVFEGVDTVGITSLVESAKLLNISVLIVTHVSVEETEGILTIVKEAGVSRIR